MSKFLLAGFGGQGILFSGKLLAKLGMSAGKEVSWLPSYGPEMRGGTANCSVIIDDEMIGSPLVTTPDILVAFNLPSLEKFENKVVKNGLIFIDSSLINKKSSRDDVKAYYVPATELASENNLSGLANVIMIGKLIKETKLFDYEYVENMLTSSVPKSKPHLAELNKKALSIGYSL